MKVRPTVSKSSIESYQTCPMKYLYENILGYRGEGGLKADIGSAVHAVMEYLALIRMAEINGGWGDNFQITIENEELGTFTCSYDEWIEERVLPNEEIDLINKGRINKKTYVDQKYLDYGISRRAEKLIDRLAKLAQAKYLDKFEPKPADIRDYRNYIDMTLEHLNIFIQNVVGVEVHFDMDLPFEWAKTEDGYFRIKGFVDLVVENTPDVIEIFDYKTGQRKELLKDEKKTYKDIKSDLQLAMYSYVLGMLYPQHTIVASLLYIRDGGLFTICSERTENQEHVEYEIKKYIQEVQSCKQPRLLDASRNHFVCKYLCPAYKNNTFSNKVCDCQFLSSAVSEMGIDLVQEVYSKEKFKV